MQNELFPHSDSKKIKNKLFPHSGGKLLADAPPPPSLLQAKVNAADNNNFILAQWS